MVSYHRHSGQGRATSWWPGCWGRGLRPGHRRRHPRRQRPGGGAGGPVRPAIPVVAIPGACAFVNALAVSGLPTGRFTFEGFLAMNKKNRKGPPGQPPGEERTMIFYEAPHKLLATFKRPGGDLRPGPAGGPVPGADQAPRGGAGTTLGQAVAHYTENPPKGSSSWWWRGRPPSRRRPPPWRRAWPWSTGSGGGVVHPGRGEGGRQPLRPAPESPSTTWRWPTSLPHKKRSTRTIKEGRTSLEVRPS